MITSFFARKKTSSSNTTKRSRESSSGSSTTATDDQVSNTEGASNSGTNDDEAMSDKRLKKSKSQDVEDILSSLQDEGWKNALALVFDSPSFGSLASFVASERKAHTIYPSPSQTWNALNYCPLDQVKVVIVGQDPYHGPGQAHGLCFSVLPGHPAPPSLKNIYKELSNDPDVANFTTKPNHGHLARWAKQGVLMLNTVMTVRRGQANSHQKKGWESVTNAILRALRDKPCVFLLWGKPAAKTVESLNSNNKSKKHVVITTSHPSPLGATKTKTPFLGSRCFSRCNKALEEMGHRAIDWKVDGEICFTTLL